MTISPGRPKIDQQQMYEDAAAEFGGALDRVARSYEADPDKRKDLLQDIHFALWRSFATFDGRCSMRTWVYRVGHNVGASHILQQRRTATRLVSLEGLELRASDSEPDETANRQVMLDRLFELVHQLEPVDRQVVLLYLDGNDATSIGEIIGISPGNVATKISRLKKILSQRAKHRSAHAS